MGKDLPTVQLITITFSPTIEDVSKLKGELLQLGDFNYPIIYIYLSNFNYPRNYVFHAPEYCAFLRLRKTRFYISIFLPKHILNQTRDQP